MVSKEAEIHSLKRKDCSWRNVDIETDVAGQKLAETNMKRDVRQQTWKKALADLWGV
jgi:hypothetical protein